MDLAQLFQSLFFWMTPIKPRHARFCRDSASVSILVLLDDSHQDTSYGEIPYIIEMFQSLFFWMTPIKDGQVAQWNASSGFQSLFFWMTPIKMIGLGAAAYGAGFQSLFFWMTPIKLEVYAATGGNIEFQSLFFWMTPIKRPRGRIRADRSEVSILVLLDDSHQALMSLAYIRICPGFNPCSSG